MSHGRAGIVLTLSLIMLAAGPALAQEMAVSRGSGSTPSAVTAEERAAVWAATEKYRDVAVAEAEGYMLHPMCMTAGMEGQPRQLGSMGYHYFRPDLLGITAQEPRVNGNGVHEDWTQPAILVYEPRSDGSVELVAIENLIWAKAWHEAGNEGRPEFHGNQYYLTIDNPATEVDEAHGFDPHYELHWWLYRSNPAGEFAPFNPIVTCDHAEPASHASR